MPDVPYTSIAHDDPMINRIQDLIARAMQFIGDNFLGNVAIIANQAIGVTDTQVFHGLGRQIRGRIIVAQSADARIWDGTASTAPSQFINLKANAAVTVSVLFF